MSVPSTPRVLCVSGASGSGKTTLLRRLLPALSLPPGEVGVVKSTHHRIDWHPGGTDSAVLWSAGPRALCVAGPDQTAIFVRHGGSGPGAPEEDDRPTPEDAPGTGDPGAATRRLVRACRRLPGGIRLVLAEGFRHARAPKIWTAAGPPGDDPPGPAVRAVVAPEADRAAWERARPGAAVFGRDAVGELTRRVPGWAEPVEGLSGG